MPKINSLSKKAIQSKIKKDTVINTMPFVLSILLYITLFCKISYSDSILSLPTSIWQCARIFFFSNGNRAT